MTGDETGLAGKVIASQSGKGVIQVPIDLGSRMAAAIGFPEPDIEGGHERKTGNRQQRGTAGRVACRSGHSDRCGRLVWQCCVSQELVPPQKPECV